MLDLPSKEARIAQRAHVPFKSEIYRSTSAKLFIESAYEQALEIADSTGKPVLCIEANQMVYPSVKALSRAVARKCYWTARRARSLCEYGIR